MLTTKDIRLLLDIANAGLHKGEVALSREIYEGILAGHPDHVPTKISLALSHIVVNDFDKADEILNGVLADSPEDADALVYLGLSARLAGRTEEAEEILARVPGDCTARELADRLLEA